MSNIRYCFGSTFVSSPPETNMGEQSQTAANPTFSTGRKKGVLSRGALRKSPLQGGGLDWNDVGWRGDAWRWLRRQVELELFDQELLLGPEFCVTAHHQGAAIGGWELHVEHLHGSQLVEHGPPGDTSCQRP